MIHVYFVFRHSLRLRAAARVRLPFYVSRRDAETQRKLFFKAIFVLSRVQSSEFGKAGSHHDSIPEVREPIVGRVPAPIRAADVPRIAVERAAPQHAVIGSRMIVIISRIPILALPLRSATLSS
jgi:hypothetical protein